MDLNEDGVADILSGSYSRQSNPMAGLFQVLYGQPGGKFKKAATLNGTDGQPLIIPQGNQDITVNICTRPFATDWDGDGDLDLVVGNFEGTFFLFTGEGKGKFLPKPQQILAERKPLRIQGAHGDPMVVDWDGDGDLDLLSGSSEGGVQFAENVAGKGKIPDLKAFKSLLPKGEAMQMGQLLSESELKGPTTSTRVWADDVNGDGKIDLLVGDNTTLNSMAPGITKEEFTKRQAKWQSDYDAIMKSYSSGNAQQIQESSRKMNEVYQKRSEFIKEDRTGFVWLYLRK